jgi:hypothetical protein
MEASAAEVLRGNVHETRKERTASRTESSGDTGQAGGIGVATVVVVYYPVLESTGQYGFARIATGPAIQSRAPRKQTYRYSERGYRLLLKYSFVGTVQVHIY